MPSGNWTGEVLSLFEVPGYQNVFAVGTFAKYVTLYSQQVRALNLIAALHERRKIGPGTPVVVIGAGAAGLMASAAAAMLGAKVTVLEELEGPMELQHNSRQRWIHPYVYDWPHMYRVNDDTTQLPILNWKASYAEIVAQQIEAEWSRIADEAGMARVFRTAVSIKKWGDSIIVYWSVPGQKPGRQSDAIVILAVGFGLEHNNPWTWSYWSDDNIDDSFRKSPHKPKWLVSGYGDGALTDLMRLCIRRFRHHEILELLQGAKDIKRVQLDIEEIHARSKTESARQVHDRYFNLETGDLEERLRPRLRPDGPEVHLTGRSPWIYGPGSSLLNRLITSLLEKNGAFRWVPSRSEPNGGGTGDIEPAKGGFFVELANGPEFYDHIICRHGPSGRSDGRHPRIRENFREVYDACGGLIARWDTLTPTDDPTRQLNWPQDFLRSRRPFESARRRLSTYLDSAKKLGVRAKSLAVYKDLRADGGSTTTFQIDELAVDDGILHGIWCQFEYTAGMVGDPVLNAAARQLNMRWISDPVAPVTDTASLHDAIENLCHRARYVSGELRFGKPLRSGEPAVSFGFSLEVLNGDALSEWEFEQLYPRLEQRVHCNGRDPIHNREFFARTVWFPVRKLHMQLRLPEQITDAPELSVFECSRRDDITRGEIAPESVLHLYPNPRPDSGLNPRFVDWNRIDNPVDMGGSPLTRASDNTWDVAIEHPPVGTAYSIDFSLGSREGEKSPEASQLAEKARQVRGHLIGLRRAAGPGRKPDVAALLHRLHAEIARLDLGLAGNEKYQIVFTAYDDENHRLAVIDGLVSGGDPSPDMWDFWLPFGVGLGGACFKQADRLFFHDRMGPQSNPDVYLSIPGRSTSAVLVAVPLDHPEYRAAARMERSRQCIGVVNIGSDDGEGRLRSIMSAGSRGTGLWEACQRFCCELVGEISGCYNEGGIC
ncbi:MAG TPA: NAD(P)/FAD-dependent oxidoreductase [Bryobacteraceae bacterium]|jgi:hypothetical protein|nr:NAD(P)/FAD-dependent oxidoreductase [Bryobacteraceae bacterium]